MLPVLSSSSTSFYIVVTDAGGFGVLIADAVDQYKMELVDFTPETVKKFRSTFPPYYQCANPMDLTGSGTLVAFIHIRISKDRRYDPSRSPRS